MMIRAINDTNRIKRLVFIVSALMFLVLTVSYYSPFRRFMLWGFVWFPESNAILPIEPKLREWWLIIIDYLNCDTNWNLGNRMNNYES